MINQFEINLQMDGLVCLTNRVNLSESISDKGRHSDKVERLNSVVLFAIHRSPVATSNRDNISHRITHSTWSPIWAGYVTSVLDITLPAITSANDVFRLLQITITPN